MKYKMYSDCCWSDIHRHSINDKWCCYSCGHTCGTISGEKIEKLKKLPSHQTPKDWEVDDI